MIGGLTEHQELGHGPARHTRAARRAFTGIPRALIDPPTRPPGTGARPPRTARAAHDGGLCARSAVVLRWMGGHHPQRRRALRLLPRFRVLLGRPLDRGDFGHSLASGSLTPGLHADSAAAGPA